MLRLFKQNYPIRNLFFFLGEGLFISLSVLLAYALTQLKAPGLFYLAIYPKALLITLIIQTCLYYANLYSFENISSVRDLCVRLLQSLGIAAVLISIAYLFLPEFFVGVDIFMTSYVILFVFILSWRLVYNEILKRGLFDKNIIIIGSDGLSQKIINEVNNVKDCGYNVACIVLEKYHRGTITDAHAPVVRKSNYAGLRDLAKKLKVDAIVVAVKEKRNQLPTSELLKCRLDGIDILDGNSFYEMLTGKLDVTQINPAWLIFSDGFKKLWIHTFFKRIADILLSLTLLFMLFPLLLLFALLIKIESQGPVFYWQERVGRKKKSFFLVKFRSMCDGAEHECGPVWADAADCRITRLGKVLRALRIDEIPQIWNVLKGEMSFVGPRPERAFFVEELEKQIPYYAERFAVKPGITGWAQVNYDYGASIEDAVEKLNYDLFYIKNMSLFMDLMITFKTVKTVLSRQGAR